MNRCCEICGEPAELTSDGSAWIWTHVEGDGSHPTQVPLDEAEQALQRLMRASQRMILGLAMGGQYVMLPLLLERVRDTLEEVYSTVESLDGGAGFPAVSQKMSSFDVLALGSALGEDFPEQWR